MPRRLALAVNEPAGLRRRLNARAGTGGRSGGHRRESGEPFRRGRPLPKPPAPSAPSRPEQPAPSRTPGLRTYRMRTLGLAMGMICVGAALHEHGAGIDAWILLAANLLVWPHLAYRLVRRSVEPVQAEYRNLAFDSAMGGFWIAAMQFALVPSAVLAVMLTMDKMIVGGWRFALRCLLGMLLTCIAASAAWGFAFQPNATQAMLLASLPLLIAYPMAIGHSVHTIWLKARHQREMLDRMARFDGATGLMNRQQWLYAASLELKRFQRSGRPAVLILIDIDHFKSINDSHGHTMGDHVVEEFARLLKACLRETDTGGRYGGDEFGIVMPETRWEEAIVAAERLRRQVAVYVFNRDGLRCTVSIGLAEINSSIASVSEWVDAADSALYRAKRNGRDCIAVY